MESTKATSADSMRTRCSPASVLFGVVAAPDYCSKDLAKGAHPVDLPALPGARVDASAIARSVRWRYGRCLPHGLVVLHSNALSADDLERAIAYQIELAAQYKKAHPRAAVTMFIAFAGHGVKSYNKDDTEAFEKGYDEGLLMPDRSVWFDDLLTAHVENCNMRDVALTCVFDTCYGGGFIGDARRGAIGAMERLPDRHSDIRSVATLCRPRGPMSLRPGAIVAASADEESLALEHAEGTEFSRIICRAIEHDKPLLYVFARIRAVNGVAALLNTDPVERYMHKLYRRSMSVNSCYVDEASVNATQRISLNEWMGHFRRGMPWCGIKS